MLQQGFSRVSKSINYQCIWVLTHSEMDFFERMGLKNCLQSLSHPIFTKCWKFWAVDLQICHGSSNLTVLGCMIPHTVTVMWLPFYQRTFWFQVALQRGPHSLGKQWGLPGQTTMLPSSSHPHSTRLFFFPFSFSLSCSIALSTQLGWAGHQTICGNNCQVDTVYLCIYVCT